MRRTRLTVVIRVVGKEQLPWRSRMARDDRGPATRRCGADPAAFGQPADRGSARQGEDSVRAYRLARRRGGDRADDGRRGNGAACDPAPDRPGTPAHRLHRRLRSEEHTSELQSLMRISYAVCCLKKKNINT